MFHRRRIILRHDIGNVEDEEVFLRMSIRKQGHSEAIAEVRTIRNQNSHYLEPLSLRTFRNQNSHLSEPRLAPFGTLWIVSPFRAIRLRAILRSVTYSVGNTINTRGSVDLPFPKNSKQCMCSGVHMLRKIVT